MLNKTVCVVGLGYVGLPLAVEFGKIKRTIGFDINQKKITELKENHDSMGGVSTDDLKSADVFYTSDSSDVGKADFIIIAVPTPVNKHNNHDLTLVKKASETVGKNMKEGSIIVYESTVYPGVTEDICRPILEGSSCLKCGTDFKIGYSPERINPGDKEHAIKDIIKVVSGMDKESLDIIAEVYGTIVRAGIYKASSIKIAEASKVIENIQRDINIALMNELAIIFGKLGINTADVIDAASTKWNFHRYTPGLVGGHCIGVDPYYLLYKAEEIGYHPEMITAGRRINDNMHKYILEIILKDLIKKGKSINDSSVTILGLTFKENVKDIRNSRAKYLIKELKEYGIKPMAHDPLLIDSEVEKEFGVKNIPFEELNCSEIIIIASPHNQFFTEKYQKYFEKLAKRKTYLIDIKGAFRNKKLPEDLIYQTL